MTEQELTHLIDLHPDRGELPIACVKAVCYVESAFDEYAYRYEPGYRCRFRSISSSNRWGSCRSRSLT
jgi:hypothetical protein